MKLMIYCANHEKEERERAKVREALEKQMFAGFAQHVKDERYVLLDFYGISQCEAFEFTVPDDGKLREMPTFSKLALGKAAAYGR